MISPVCRPFVWRAAWPITKAGACIVSLSLSRAAYHRGALRCNKDGDSAQRCKCAQLRVRRGPRKTNQNFHHHKLGSDNYYPGRAHDSKFYHLIVVLITHASPDGRRHFDFCDEHEKGVKNTDGAEHTCFVCAFNASRKPILIKTNT